MSTFKDLTVEKELTVNGSSSISGTANIGKLKINDSSCTINGLFIAKGTTGSLNAFAKLQELPEGFTPLNSVVLGWALTATNGNKVEHAPSVNVWLGNQNIQVRVTDAGYVNCDLTVYVMRITE